MQISSDTMWKLQMDKKTRKHMWAPSPSRDTLVDYMPDREVSYLLFTTQYNFSRSMLLHSKNRDAHYNQQLWPLANKMTLWIPLRRYTLISQKTNNKAWNCKMSLILNVDKHLSVCATSSQHYRTSIVGLRLISTNLRAGYRCSPHDK